MPPQSPLPVPAFKWEGPSVSELSEQIKAIKAANSIEGTPQHIGQRHSPAEEPITARIRCRTETNRASNHVTELDIAPEVEGVRTRGSVQNSSLDSPRTFQDRILKERHAKDDSQCPP